MSKLAIGMIETMGLAAGIEAADICLKAANINLVGYEFAKGSGMTVIKIEGNVGAVKAAISAATAALGKLGKVHTKMVIPRPSDSIDMLIRNESTVGYEDEKEEIPQVKQNNPRIINQSGAFLLFGINKVKGVMADLDSSWLPLSDKLFIHDKKKIRNDLELMGITASFVYPEMENYSKKLKEIYK